MSQSYTTILAIFSDLNMTQFFLFLIIFSDLISLSSDFVEPLQIVSYTGGQKFDLHHDAGTLTEDGDIEIVQPRR